MNIITRRPDNIFLFGNPVGHSKSPLIMNAVFCKLGLNAVYIPVNYRRPEGRQLARLPR
jgi:shikimate dehydrogenase